MSNVLSRLKKKELARLTTADWLDLIQEAESLHFQKSQAHRTDDEWCATGVRLEYADGNVCEMDLTRIGWKAGTRWPMSFRLPCMKTLGSYGIAVASSTPDMSSVNYREFAFIYQREWNGQLVYQEVST